MQRTLLEKPIHHPPAAYLVVEDLHKYYGTVKALDGVNLKLNRGEFLTLLGPSGSGKTTLLMAVAGFVFPTRGRIVLDGSDLSRIPPYNRGLGMVFQDYALFPHLNVFENVAFPLKMRNMASAQIRPRVQESLELVRLSGLDRRKPAQLSGGQQQRVALARALVFRPHVLLMDEPLGALDKKLREEMQIELKHIQQQLAITVLSVTHDQEEALTLSDRIAVINAGRLEQVGTACEIYEQPATPFVADFIGETNFLDVRVHSTDGQWLILFNEGLQSAKVGAVDGVTAGDAGILSVRPEKISFIRSEQDAECCAEGVVKDILYIGDTTRYYVELKNRKKIVVKQHNREGMPDPKSGASVWIGWGAGNAVWLPRRHD